MSIDTHNTSWNMDARYRKEKGQPETQIPITTREDLHLPLLLNVELSL